jgi:hypothetical protein
MANTNSPNGLIPVKHLNGSPYNGGGNVYSIAAAYAAAALYIGDPVISSGSADSNGIAGITLAAATGAVRGVIVAIGQDPNFYANPNSLNTTYRPAAAQTTDWYALVVDDPDVIFQIQEVGTGTPLTATAVGLNTNMVVGAGNGFVSGWTLDNATEDTTSSLQCRILGLARTAPIANAYGQYAKWLVKINNHELSAGTDGV